MMDFDSFANYIIESLISKEDLSSIINHMIESYDKTKKYFHSTESSAIFAKYTNNFNIINKVLRERAEKIIEEKDSKEQSGDDFLEWDWLDSFDFQNIEKESDICSKTERSVFVDQLVDMGKDPDLWLKAGALYETSTGYSMGKDSELWLKKGFLREEMRWGNMDKDSEIWLMTVDMFTGILRKIEFMAIERKEDRINHRFKVGSRININNYEFSEYGNLIEFHHDGGWGVADKNGVVLISNHLTTKASKCHPLFHPTISNNVTNHLYVSTDIDTELKGIITINPLKELLPCKYKIESMEGMRDGNYIFAFKALSKNGLWGCYNDRGKKITKFKYQTIEFNQGFVECGRDGIFHLQDHDNGDGGWDNIFDGPKDLYDHDGHLILGGYTEFKYLEGYNLYLFYFDTYKTPTPYDVGNFTIDKYNTCYEEAKCLILDKDFNIFLNEEKLCIKGTILDSLEDIPSSCLVNGKVLEVLNNYVVSNETEFKNVEDIDGLPCYETEVKKVITFYNGNGHVEWRKAVDDYYGWSHPELVLIDQKVGFLNSTGLNISTYDAISKDSDENGNLFAAKIVKLSAKEAKRIESNPNLQEDKRRSIQYYLVSMQGAAPIRLEDNWETFNPNKISWFPDDFLEKMGVYPDDGYVDDYYEHDNRKSCGWSFEDLEDAYWDALENDPSNEWNID